MALGAQQDSSPSLLWAHSFSSDVNYHEVTALGTVLVSTEAETTILDPVTGDVVWTSTLLRDCNLKNKNPVGYRRISNAVWCRWGDKNWFRLSTFELFPIILAAGEAGKGEGLVILDIGNGDVIWDSSELEMDIERVGWSERTEEARVVGWGEDSDGDRSLIFEIDLQSRALRWTTELPLKKDLSLHELEDILVITGESQGGQDMMVRIDMETGALLYANELPLKNDWEFIRESNPAMLLGESRDGGDVVIGVDLNTGEILYSSSALGEELEDDDRRRLVSDRTIPFDPADLKAEFGDTLEIFSDGDKRVLGVNPRTGAILWNPERSTDLKAWTYSAGTLYVKDAKHVTAYRTEDGSELWQRESDAWYGMWITDQGVLVGCVPLSGNCGTRLEFYGLEDGASIWPRMVELGEKAVEFIIVDEALFAVSKDHVYRVELSTASYEEILEFEFRGDEVPTAVVERDGGLLLMSNQNTLFVDADGEFRYHKYYKAPGMSLLEKVGRTALAVAETAANRYEARGRARSMANASALTGGSGRGYALYERAYPSLALRRQASSETENFRYIYTEDQRGEGDDRFYLARFNLELGEEDGRAPVGKRKTNFQLDPIDQIVYVKRDGRTIDALRFEGGN